MDSSLADVALASLLFVISGATASFLAIRVGISVLPFWIISITLVSVGLATRWPGSPLFLGQADGDLYLDWAGEITQTWQSGESWPYPLWPGKGFFPLIIAGFQYFVGPALISVVVFNSIVFSFSILILQHATALVFGTRPKWSIVFLTLSNASILVHAPAVLRESIFWLGLSAGILALAYFHNKSDLAGAVTLTFGITTMLAIRPNLGLIMSFLVFTVALSFWTFRKGQVSLGRTVLGVCLVLAASLATILSYPAMFGTDDLQHRVRKTAMELGTEGVTSALSVETSSAPEFCSSFPLLQLVFEAGLRLPSIMFGPFPWEVGADLVWVLAILSGLHWLFILATSTALILGLRPVNPVAFSLYGVAGIVILVLSATMANYGIIVRFRVVAELFLLPLSLAYLGRFSGQRAYKPEGLVFRVLVRTAKKSI